MSAGTTYFSVAQAEHEEPWQREDFWMKHHLRYSTPPSIPLTLICSRRWMENNFHLSQHSWSKNMLKALLCRSEKSINIRHYSDKIENTARPVDRPRSLSAALYILVAVFVWPCWITWAAAWCYKKKPLYCFKLTMTFVICTACSCYHGNKSTQDVSECTHNTPRRKTSASSLQKMNAELNGRAVRHEMCMERSRLCCK